MINSILESITNSNAIKFGIVIAIVLFIIGFMKLKGKLTTKNLAYMSLLVALSVILKRFVSIEVATERIGFTYIATALMGALFGPWVGGAGSVIADFIGMILFPKGMYFPGFTLTAFLEGFTYGIFFNKKDIKIVDVVLSTLIVGIGWHLFMNTYWLSMIQQTPFLPLVMVRIPKQLLVMPIEAITLYLLMPRLVREIRKIAGPELTVK